MCYIGQVCSSPFFGSRPFLHWFHYFISFINSLIQLLAEINIVTLHIAPWRPLQLPPLGPLDEFIVGLLRLHVDYSEWASR
jgi:hypothetical protein